MGNENLRLLGEFNWRPPDNRCNCPRPMYHTDNTRLGKPFITCVKCGKYPRTGSAT